MFTHEHPLVRGSWAGVRLGQITRPHPSTGEASGQWEKRGSGRSLDAAGAAPRRWHTPTASLIGGSTLRAPRLAHVASAHPRLAGAAAVCAGAAAPARAGPGVPCGVSKSDRGLRWWESGGPGSDPTPALERRASPVGERGQNGSVSRSATAFNAGSVVEAVARSATASRER